MKNSTAFYDLDIKSLNVKALIKKVPELESFGLQGASIVKGSLYIVSDYDIPTDLFKKLEQSL